MTSDDLDLYLPKTHDSVFTNARRLLCGEALVNPVDPVRLLSARCGTEKESLMGKQRPKGTRTVQIDNSRLRVTLWSFVPDATTGFHHHQYDYCVVPVVTGRLLIEEGGTTSEAALTAGKAYYREAGVAHDVINGNPFDFAFVEIELKEPHPQV